MFDNNNSREQGQPCPFFVAAVVLQVETYRCLLAIIAQQVQQTSMPTKNEASTGKPGH